MGVGQSMVDEGVGGTEVLGRLERTRQRLRRRGRRRREGRRPARPPASPCRRAPRRPRPRPHPGPASASTPCSTSAVTTASVITSPPVEPRLARMRSTSTSRSSSRSARRSAAPAVRASAVRSGSHSACQGPAARWCSWSWAPSTIEARPFTWWAAETTSVARAGLRLCGMADEPPLEPSRTSPTSVRASAMTSVATLPTLPATIASVDASSAVRTRVVCQGSGGATSPRRAASCSTTAGPAPPSGASVPAAPPSWTARRSAATRAASARASTRPTSQVAAVSPKVIGHGVLAQRAPDGDVAPVALGQRGRGRGGSLQLVVQSGQRPFGQQHQRRVDDVLARGADVHRRPRLRRHRGPQVGDERDDRVAGLRRPPSQVGQIEAVGLATRG